MPKRLLNKMQRNHESEIDNSKLTKCPHKSGFKTTIGDYQGTHIRSLSPVFSKFDLH